MRDPSQYSSAVAAEAAGIAHVRVATGLSSAEDFAIGVAAPVLDELRNAAGLPADPHGARLRRSPYLTMFPASFEDPSALAQPDTRRFRDPAWSDNPIFDYVKESYLLTADAILSAVRKVDGLDPKAAHKAEFYARQFVDAIAPSNFAATNPEVLKATLESGGNLATLLGDIFDRHGLLLTRPPAAAQPAGPAPILPSAVRPGTGPP